MSSIRTLNLEDNELTNSVVILDLSLNDIPGRFPAWLLENNTKLKMLFMANNLFTTLEVPSMTLFYLWSMDISNNSMRGELTTEFCANVPNLSHLILSANRLEGNIPSELGSIKFLHILDLSSNNFSGGLPIQRFDSYKGYSLLKMVGLLLSCNQFSGEIPPEIAILQEMLVLNLSHNKLTGRIPMSLSSLTKIESIDLSYNNLIGSISEELTQLNSLEVFNVSYNDLLGTIPNKYQFGAFDESSYYGNHLLCGLPLSKKCSTIINVNCSATKSCPTAKEDGFIDEQTFYISFGVSYTTIGLVIPVVLFINPQWRQGWFHYVELVITTLMVGLGFFFLLFVIVIDQL
ncbi:hypothetical protein EUGRSUZ_E04282 [Eucalyptus grandis]|uniref:Uncharacterized protein n=2 Tax=Eucalyptus grandis TaxID=71139 RepID=A0ACC3L3F2_EUCGR|nr:hypothetical protein EUGRSUZ_E04282 [Eucalyptus grandis]